MGTIPDPLFDQVSATTQSSFGGGKKSGKVSKKKIAKSPLKIGVKTKRYGRKR